MRELLTLAMLPFIGYPRTLTRWESSARVPGEPPLTTTEGERPADGPAMV